MKLFNAKTGIVAVLALIVVGAGLLCFLPVDRPSLRLVFLSATNDVQTGTSWGMFRLENKSTNYMSAASGYFQERTGFGWAKIAGAYDPRPGATNLRPPLLAPGALTFQTQVPSGEASYRLVLKVVPCIDIRDVGKPLPARNGLVYRAGSLLLRFGLLPQKLQQALLSNSRWLETKPFRVSSPTALPRTPGSPSASNSQDTAPAPLS